ncbi:MAG: histidine phosphatase family protein [Patescibacteria group bacterium]
MKLKNKQLARIFLVRHGQVENPKKIVYGYLPFPLNKTGQTQAKRAGLSLKNKKIAAIFASPQKRCQQTATIIKKTIGGKIKIITSRDLRESGFGHATEGWTVEEYDRQHHKEHLIYTRTPGKSKVGETLANMARRVQKIIQTAIKKYPGQNLVFVSHRDPILAFLLKIAKRDFNDLHKVKAICDKGAICEVWSVGQRLINKTYLAS